MPQNKTVEIGYKLSSEEFSAGELIRFARAAEERGFSFALISDHYHPWTGRQGQSPFVWATLGGIARSTTKLMVGTGVTCPTQRIHPAIVAQAAATVASMMPGRFFLGVGSGENLNEHITGERWPEVDVRREKLAEAIGIIRMLWQGGLRSHHGKHFVVENARLYSLPPQAPALLVAAGGAKAAELAGRLGDGLIGTAPEGELIEKFREAGGNGKPCYGEMQVCYGEDEKRAVETARDVWPIAVIPGAVDSELPLPSQFEKLSNLVKPQDLANIVPCGPDPEKHLRSLRQYIDAGYDHVCVHQIGPAQEEFMDFYAREVMPKVRKAMAA